MSCDQKLDQWGFVAEGLSGYLEGFKKVEFSEIAARYAVLFSAHDSLVQSIPRSSRIGIQKLIQYEDIPPCMYTDGSFHPFYAYFILGLFLNRITQCIKSSKISLNILCMGWNYRGDEIWWEKEYGKDELNEVCMKITDHVFSSEAFDTIKHTTESLIEGKQSRTIVWLLSKGHGFAIGWNISKISTKLHCKVFRIDALDRNPIADVLLEMFSSKLQTMIGGTISTKLSSIVDVSDVRVSDDFPCVPFLARATLYASMVDSLDEIGEIYDLARKLDLNREKNLYHLFEKTMLEFTESEAIKKKCIFLPPKLMIEKIININEFFLESMGSNGQSVQYVFNGFELKFVDKKGLDCEPCRIQSCFFNVLDEIRKCQALVIWTRQRLLTPNNNSLTPSQPH